MMLSKLNRSLSPCCSFFRLKKSIQGPCTALAQPSNVGSCKAQALISLGRSFVSLSQVFLDLAKAPKRSQRPSGITGTPCSCSACFRKS